MAAMLKDLQRKISNKNANGDLLCGITFIDLVEDRVRKRWTAVALLFGFVGPIIMWATAGRLNTTWNRYDAAPLMTTDNTSDPFGAWTTLASYACTAEQLCLQNASDASLCSALCLELFSGLNVAAGLSVSATIPEAQTVNGVNGTVVTSNATVAQPTSSNDETVAQPTSSNDATVAQPTSSYDETGAWVGVIVCWILTQMKKYILLIVIIFASCAEQKQEPETAGYSIRGDEESYMIGSDETTDFIRKWAEAHNQRDMESILSMEKTDIKIELPDGTVINGQDEHSKVLESFFANNVTWKPYWILPYNSVKAQEKWVIAGFALTSNVDGEENVILHMGDIQLEDGLVSRIIVYENQRPKKG